MINQVQEEKRKNKTMGSIRKGKNPALCFKCQLEHRYKKQTYCYSCFYEKFGKYQKEKYAKKREKNSCIKVKTINGEIWKTTGYSGYSVSNIGRVKSIHRNDRWGNIHNSEYLLKATIDANGYRVVKLYCNGSKFSFKVHKLVAISFVKRPRYKTDIHHKDSNRLNNTPTNLKWVTKSEHTKITHKDGRIQYKIGQTHPMAKLKNKDIIIIRKMYESGYKNSEIASVFDVSKQNISRIIERKIWRHIQ